MCGRYQLNKIPREIRQYFPASWSWRFPKDLGVRHYNIAPQQTALVVRALDDQPTGEALRWSFWPAGWRSTPRPQINARSESAFSKPMFKHAARERRCLALSTGWYEWSGDKPPRQPYLFRYPDERVFAFAGLWTSAATDNELDSFAILTVPANMLAASIHDRMPAIVRPDDYETWLDTSEHDETRLLQSFANETDKELETYPVSTLVNNPKHDDARCEEPVEPAQRSLI